MRPNSTGDNIRDLRLRAGLSQVQLARALGYKRNDLISRWENNRVMPSRYSLARLAAVLGCTVHDILPGRW